MSIASRQCRCSGFGRSSVVSFVSALKNDSWPSASVTRFQLRGRASLGRRPKDSVRRIAPEALVTRFGEEAAGSAAADSAVAAESAGGTAASDSVVYPGSALSALLLRRLVKESERPSPAAAPAALVADAAAAEAAADAASRADAAAAALRALARIPALGAMFSQERKTRALALF